MPSERSVLAIRKWDDEVRFDWNLATVSRINRRKRMHTSVEYFDEEPHEPLNLNQEQ